MNTISLDIIDRLQEHARLHDLDCVAAEGIRKWLANGKIELFPDGISPDQVTWRFESRWLCFEPRIISYSFIDTRFTLLTGDKMIGYYRLITQLNGEIDDDYFVLEPKA